ncbi:MAG: DUF4445 domain-containing protein, partial [Lachnospiraceae bacterium]|nr:DUF4445 domain-containing protein [Lachnospiraceae bacterium]
PSDCERIYVAGGFGYSIDLQKAAALGLFPDGCGPLLKAVGNTSLAGCRSLLAQQDERRPERIAGSVIAVNLAQNDHFNEKYLERMYFPKW